MARGRLLQETAPEGSETAPKKVGKGGKRSPGRKGGRPSNVMAPVARPELPDDEVEAIRSLTATTLRDLKQLQGAIATQMAAGEVTAAVQREATGLARAIIALGAEQRQQDKYWEDRNTKMSSEEEDQMVIDFLGEVTPSRRARIRVAILEMDAQATLLG